MSVKSRILQFQKEENNNVNNTLNVFSIANGQRLSSSSSSPLSPPLNQNDHQQNRASSTITKLQQSTVTRKLSNGNGSVSSHSNSNNTHQHSLLNGNNNNRNTNNTPTSTSTATAVTVTTGAAEKNFFSSSSSPRQNSMEKPVMASSKKTSLSINLNSSNNNNMNQMNGNVVSSNVSSGNNFNCPKTPTSTATTTGFTSNLRPRTPTSKMSTSGIPMKGSLIASSPFHNSLLSKTNQRNHSASSSIPLSSSSGVIDWKLKYEESENKRLTVVTLAQKATRDYEELRRRFRASELEREKLAKKLDSSVSQLDLLRKAAENTYEEYHKLKKQYENENRNKSEALTRVDQYNKENRRLKRQSFQLMQKIDPSNYTIEEEKEVVDAVENDQEIMYLRSKVQELEGKIVKLETELEKTKLAEFETQEFMLMNDVQSSSASEVKQLNEQIMKLEEGNRKLHDSLDDALIELENIKTRDIVEHEKLQVAEIELRKMRTEKNILQRQSMVFMSDMGMDQRLMDALSQISDLQTTLEDQKNDFQSQITELSRCLNEREISEETLKIQTDAKVKSLEEEVKTLRDRTEEAERKLDEVPVSVNISAPPPPPPPPMMACPPPCPPPPPPMMMTSLSASLNKPLRKTPGASMENLADDSSNERSTNPGNAQIDDVVSQIKKGIKLRSTQDRTLLRKQTEVEKPPPEAVAVEEMKNILNNLKRTRRFNS